MIRKLTENKLLRKFLSFSMGNWIVLIISLVSTPIMTRILSPEDYGTLSLFLIVINLFNIISLLGIDQSFIRFYYESDIVRRQFMLNIAILVSSTVFILIILLMALTKPFSTYFLLGTNDNLIFIVFCLVLLVSIYNRYNYVLLRMEQKGKLYSLLQVIQKLIDFTAFLGLYYIFIKEDINLYLAVYSYAIASIVVFLVGLIINNKVWINTLKQAIETKFDFKMVKDLIYYGIPLSITVLITWVFQFVDRMILNHYAGVYEVGIYMAAFKLVAIISIIQTSFTTFWVPLSNQRFVQNSNDKEFFEKMFSKVLYAMIGIGLLVILFKDVLVIFFGQDFASAVDLIPMLILVPITYTLSEITVVGINFFKKTKFHIYISLIACLVNVLGLLALVPLYGAQGAAISTGITYVLYFLIRSYVGLKLFSFNIVTWKNCFLFVGFLILCVFSFI